MSEESLKSLSEEEISKLGYSAPLGEAADTANMVPSRGHAAVLEEEEIKEEEPSTLRKALFVGEPSDKAYSPGQMHAHSDTVKLKTVEVKILQLHKAADLAEYNKILTKDLDEDDGMFIVEQERKYSEAESSWVVFLKLHHFQFYPLLKNQDND